MSRFALRASYCLVAAFSVCMHADTPERALINQACAGCHSKAGKAANLAFETAGTPADHPEIWEKVLRRLRGRTMPPAGIPRPPESVYLAAIQSLEATLNNLPVNPGRSDTFRRLNRTEYQNAIRDLLAVEVDVANLLPADESSHGFDNITVGDLSPTLLERYLSAARKISRTAVGIPARAPGGETVNLPADLTQEEHFEGLPLGTRGGKTMRYTFPVDAEYEIQIRLARDRNEHVEGIAGTHAVELLIDGASVKRFTVKSPPNGQDHSAVDTHLNLRLPIKAGPHTLAATFPRQTGALLETERQPYQAHFNMDRHPRVQPAVYSLTINGPYGEQHAGNSPSRRRLFVCRPAKAGDEEPCARRIFSTVARRAYRRPVTAADLAAPLRFFKEQPDFDTGIEMGLRAILVSPEFLFRVEADPPGAAPKTPYRLSNLELATRLSFFLWSSIPDDELLDAAIQGKLSQPAVLDRQVRRMLADPRASVLVTNFAEQWLYLRNLNASMPDMRLYAGFDDNLRQSFRRETELFVESIMREDRSILDLLRADYTFVNGRLAKHYGIPNIYGSRFQRVMLGKDRVRGGLLRQGSILTVTSYATRTSPVIRGKWVLENILGVPPPPPPPAVPALAEKVSTGQPQSMRERLAEHRDNPACRGCHQLMDPIGFALESYDAVGRYRTTENAKPLDVSGGLPDGSKFSGVDGLQEALLRRPEIFAGTFAEKLMTYALGRGVETTDAPAIRRIVQETKTKDFKFSSFILGIVTSTPFQMRRSS
ncbi:MAG TPA: DUF1592 domain-containing protein [Bryobacteraceae bacterium]|nr:DUF1592 domain-containing protein [Bryobacteraceae bacterium]